MTQHNIFWPARTVRSYGFDANHRPIEEAASPSGYLLPWEAIDAEADAVSTRRPCQFVVVGEYVRDDGVRLPELGVNPDWMHDQGFVHVKKGPWDKNRSHEHVLHLTAVA
jgi:hypothetical protein